VIAALPEQIETEAPGRSETSVHQTRRLTNILFTLLHAACRAVGCPDRFGQERPASERTAWEE